MAKRYTRINWLNRPNVATPINATNLNKMDKGINDIDNAIEEIYNKRVNNVVTTNPDTFLSGAVGKTLQDQITTLNNDLDSHLAENATQTKLGHIKLQEPWIAATLQNGWTGNLRYAKNDLGIVTLTGNITPGTKAWGTIIAGLPLGYRPVGYIKPISCYRTSGNVINGLVINSNGNVLVYNPASTDTNLDGEIHLNVSYYAG